MLTADRTIVNGSGQTGRSVVDTGNPGERRVNPTSRWVVCLGAMIGLFGFPSSGVAQSVPSDFPFAIICWSEEAQNWRVGYLYTVNEDNSATYFSPNGQLSVGVGSDGIVKEPVDRPAANDCFGRSIEDLRAEGRVLEFHPGD